MTALQARVSDVEVGHGDTLYKLRRESVGMRLDLSRMLAHMGIPSTTAAEVDEVLDAE
jgi:hypothetical protein